ncbi:MAG: hypothetical protein WBN22_13775 [Verrucomicrobiia bacterium]
MKPQFYFPLAAALGLLLPPASGAQSVHVKSAAGITVRLDESSGRYEIVSRRPDWKFAGELGGPAKEAGVGRGTDRIGAYQEIHFLWPADAPVTGSIRVYDKQPVALFTLTCDQAADKWPAVFPRFTSFPAKLHHFSFGEKPFAPPHFDLETNGTPWLLFDDHATAALISPADDFMLATMTGDGIHEITSTLNRGAHGLPAHFSHSTLMAFAPGIHAVWQIWGGALMALQGKTPPSNAADTGLRYLGYWTDNGATYYYNYEPALGYAGTLEKLAARYRDEGIPIRYLQLDSWWYDKTFTGPDGKAGGTKNSRLPAGEWNRYGGLLKYEADPAVLPDGLAGLGLITHNRWIDPASPYRDHYKISGFAAVDPKWWDDIMGYLADGGVFCYEQDWLSEIYYHSPELQTVPGVGDAFADNMARAARERGLSLQYCMALPRFFLQGARYADLTSIRTSGDRFGRNQWDDFLYVSQLARAVGIWPWADVFLSGETNNLLISDLSAGMVGVGDAIGQENKDNLMRVARPDGVLVKSDESLLPLDSVYVAQANGRKTPMMAWTYSDHGTLRTAYVFAYNRQPADAEADFSPAQFGLTGKVCVLDARSGNAVFQSARKTVQLSFKPGDTAYDEITPVGRSGLAFFGDAGKFVSNGRQRIAALDDADGKLTVTTTFAPGEKSVRLFGYASQPPTVAAKRGSVGMLAFDDQTRRFSVEVMPAPEVIRSGRDPVQTAVVEFETR